MQNRFMDWFGLSVPILQAPIAGSDTPQLAAEVGRAGGMGSLALTWTGREAGRTRVAELCAHGTPFFLNFVLRFGTGWLDWYEGFGIKAVTLSWGIDPAAIAALHSRGIRVGVQVGSAAGARATLAAGADFIITQGIEAGGHVQSTTPLARVLADTVALAGDTPVIAAGGLSTGADVARVMKAGAQGAMMGTRFVAAAESCAHKAYKAELVAAGAEDTVYTNCFDIGWPYAMHRVLRNKTFREWEAAGCPAAPARPGEGDIILRSAENGVPRYHNDQPKEDFGGDALAGCLYAGTSVDGITSVRPAAEIVSSLWAEAQSLL